jgi:mRNA-degrading endonuclease toxin of MazEF toxin-antitoxin module
MEKALTSHWFDQQKLSTPFPDVRRGEVWMVDDSFSFDAFAGKNSSVQQVLGVRPYLICQSNMGSSSPVVLASSVSSSIRENKNYHFIQDIFLEKDSQIHYEQVNLLPKFAFVKRIGKLSLEKIKEMDLRLAIPLALDKSSILHIEGVIVSDSEIWKSEQVYWGVVKYRFFDRKIRFTKQDFINFFGTAKSYVLENHVSFISEFLETLHGLKFVYSVIIAREAEVSASHELEKVTILT